MLRQGDWKLTIQSNDKLTKWEPTGLYNLKANRMENPRTNLIKNPEYAAKLAAMEAHYHKVRNSKKRTEPNSN